LTLAPQAIDDLRAYPWPGNVRELQNCIERAVILSDDDTIQPRHLSLSSRSPVAAAGPVSPWDQIDLRGNLADVMRRVGAEVEKRKLEQALKDAGGNRQRAADLLLVNYRIFLQKLKEHGLPVS
jgi:DNA-binding NtrC family response regulator